MAAKGQTKSGGRRKGTPNRLGKEVRELVREALDRAGGAEYLLRAAKEQPQAFMSLLGRLVPSEIKGVIESDITVIVTTGIGGAPGTNLGSTGTRSDRFKQDYARQQVLAHAAEEAVPAPDLAAGPEPIRPYVPPESVPVPVPEPEAPKPESFGTIRRPPETERQEARWDDGDDPRERITFDLKR